MQQASKNTTRVEIRETMSRSHSVFILLNYQWQAVSDHRFQSHAEEIKLLIEKGATRLKVEEKIKEQKIYGRSVFTAPYYVNF